MQWFRFAVLIILATVLQAGFVTTLDIRPDLLLVTLVFIAVYCGTTEAIIASFAIGFASDLIGSPSTMGSQMITFGISGTLLAYLNRVVAIRKMPFQAVAIFVLSFLAIGTAQVLVFALKSEPISPKLHKVLLWTAIYSGIVGPFLFLPMAWWMRIKIDRFNRRQHG